MEGKGREGGGDQKHRDIADASGEKNHQHQPSWSTIQLITESTTWQLFVLLIAATILLHFQFWPQCLGLFCIDLNSLVEC